ncbi:protein NRT1/ PTR FAMILY 7.3-like isoform X2 [Silene latifolia]|uniref:protein NRT1/ PTR FAMILY 7.3-like isoform X2 n=1 Tax=Silene latifolia TaxID=37657 RepID=UPI003D785CA3
MSFVNFLFKANHDETRDERTDKPAQTGGWTPSTLLLVNQALAILAYFGIGVNLVLFLTRVLGESNVNAANSVSKWTGTMYLFSLLGAFVSDTYWGRYKTCAIFQAIFVIGLTLFSLLSTLILLKPKGCGDEQVLCNSHTAFHKALFYVAMYVVALGMGGYQPNIAVFGADQFDDRDVQQQRSKLSYFSFFVLALNLGSFLSKMILGNFEDGGNWVVGFWTSTGSAVMGLALFFAGARLYRTILPSGNCASMVFRAVATAMSKRQHVDVEQQTNDNNFRELEKVKHLVRLIPIWLCIIFYSVVFAQMSSLFMEQGAAMKKKMRHMHISPATVSVFNIISVAIFIFFNRFLLSPLVTRQRNRALSELERMGVGLVIAFFAMMAAGLVEFFRRKYAIRECPNASCLSILWQIPQYMLIGASEVFMGVARLEFFYGQAPEELKCFGNALCLTSIALGNYLSSFIATIVTKISTSTGTPGWISQDLNKGHLERFYFLLAALIMIDFVVYLFIARAYKYVQSEVVK